MPSDVRYAEVVRMLAARGYHLHRVHGSHHVLQHASAGTFSLPVHRGKVK
jgi:predicted RNA binding protein YcfA (HicA-like mRNA interferase family)